MVYLKFIFLLIFCCGHAAVADPNKKDLQIIQKQIEEQNRLSQTSKENALKMSKEIKDVQSQMVKAAKNVQVQETKLEKLEEKLRELDGQEEELKVKLGVTETHLVRLTQALQTLALRPRKLVFLKKDTPVNHIRSLMLIENALPVVGNGQSKLKKGLFDLYLLRAQIEEKKKNIETERLKLEEKSAQMTKLIQQKSFLQAQYNQSHKAAKKKAQQLASQAKDLRELIEKLEKEREAKIQQEKQVVYSVSGSFEKSYGSLIYPVQGYIVQKFGDETVSGAHLKGMTLKARTGSPVVSPFDGHVLFSGPFKSYGQMIIVDNGDGYITLLAGLGEITTSVGQEVMAGEPIGRIGKGENMYIEIRKNGQPINPKPWFVNH